MLKGDKDTGMMGLCVKQRWCVERIQIFDMEETFINCLGGIYKE